MLGGGKTPKQVSNLKICDPACGSGSFLLGAYQYLLDWHRDFYVNGGPEKYKKELYRAASGEWRLAIQERKRILLNNIYGVDIDPQAVETTKLSLLLKVLEQETEESLRTNMKLFHERALPDLGGNIKCGNSLIGADYFDGKMAFLTDDERQNINPFDWHNAFPAVFTGKEPGFDAVIGNPPYVRQELLGDFKEYFESRYKTYNGVADLYVYFIEKAVSMLKGEGLFSYIVSNKWMRANYGEAFRSWLVKRNVVELVDFGDLPVFKGVTTYPCILTIKGNADSAAAKSFSAVDVKTLEFPTLAEYVKKNSFNVEKKSLPATGWHMADKRIHKLLEKIKAAGIPLGEYVEGKIYRGVLTGLNEAFVIDDATRKKLIAEDPKSKELIKPFLRGRDIKRYSITDEKLFLIFTLHGVNINNYPAIKRHLLQYKERLMPKPANYKGKAWPGRKPGKYEWHEIQDTVDYYAEFEKPNIVYAEIATRGQFTIDLGKSFPDTTVYILGSDSKYLLGILNSKLCTFLVSATSSEIRGGFFRWKRQYMVPLPIKTIDAKNKHQVASQQKIVSLVDQMLDSKDKVSTIKTPHDKELIQRQIDAADRQIDKLVYELYGLTAEEIALIEGAAEK